MRIRFTLATSVVAVVALACAAAPLPGQDEPDSGLKLTKSSAKSLVRRLGATSERQRKAAREKLLRTRKADLPYLFDALQANRPAMKRPRGRTPIEVEVEQRLGTAKKGRFLVHLPRRYKGKKPMPLLFLLDGYGGGADKISRLWDDRQLTEKFITVTPDLPYQSSKPSQLVGLIDKIYRHMLEHYNIDTDRVYHMGYFAGGGFGFQLAQRWPERVAALYAQGRLSFATQKIEDALPPVLRCPGYFVIRDQDDADRRESHRVVQEFFADYPDYEGVFETATGRGTRQIYMVDYNRPGCEFLLEHSRKRYPKRFHALFSNINPDWDLGEYGFRQQWLRVETMTNVNATCEVWVTDNTIRIRGEHVAGGYLLLNDHLVNLDEEIVIDLNGKEVFRGKIQRSAAFLLDWYDEHRDPGYLFWNWAPFGRRK